MSKKKKNFSSDFKVQVIKDVLKENATLVEVADKNGTIVRNVSSWVQQFNENATRVFDRNKTEKELEDKLKEQRTHTEELIKVIGEQKVIIDFFKKKYRDVGLSLQEYYDRFES